MGACSSSLTVDYNECSRNSTQMSTSSTSSCVSSSSLTLSSSTDSSEGSERFDSCAALSPLGELCETDGKKKRRSIFRRSCKRKEAQHVLLLGASESGKTTLMKQIRMMHNNGHFYEERVMYRKIVLNNIVSWIQQLIEYVCEAEDAQLSEYIKIRVSALRDLQEVESLTKTEAEAVATLWQQRIFQDAYEAHYSSFPQTIEYFMRNVEKIAVQDYIPTEQDILMVGRKTVGICAMELKLGGVLLRLVDVGGQRKERRKWAHFFEGVTAVVFCASLADYDQCLEEDPTANRMRESLQLFGDMMKEEKLKGASVILFLNKKDIFKQKIKQQNITTAFPSYKGAQDYEEAHEYIRQQFLSLNPNPEERDVFCHTTCAVDTVDIRNEWSSTLHHILFKNLSVVY